MTLIQSVYWTDTNKTGMIYTEMSNLKCNTFMFLDKRFWMFLDVIRLCFGCFTHILLPSFNNRSISRWV